jgi:putative transposase
METVKTLKLRIRDRHAKAMLAMARDVNTVWNFANETQYRSQGRSAKTRLQAMSYSNEL